MKATIKSIANPRETVRANVIDMDLTVDFGDGQGDQTIPYTYDPSDNEGVAPAVGAYIADHPISPVPYVAPAPTRADVVAERERRLGLGFDYDFGDARGVHHIGTSRDDMVGWDDVTTLANALVASGDTTTEIGILTDTGSTQVTGPEWQQVLIAAGQFRQPIWAASFALVAQNPIPANYADDSNWPAS